MNPIWKEKYEIHHCGHCCDSWVIVCPTCHNSSCNGASCRECHKDFEEFEKLKNSTVNFLSEEEIRVFNRISRLRQLILTCLENGKSPIDWAWLEENRKLPDYDRREFASLIEAAKS